MFHPHIHPLMTAIKHLSGAVEDLIKKIDDMQHQINAMEMEWRNEYEPEWSEDDSIDSEESSDSDSDSDQSVQSAPATFSYKRQRTD